MKEMYLTIILSKVKKHSPFLLCEESESITLCIQVLHYIKDNMAKL